MMAGRFETDTRIEAFFCYSISTAIQHYMDEGYIGTLMIIDDDWEEHVYEFEQNKIHTPKHGIIPR